MDIRQGARKSEKLTALRRPTRCSATRRRGSTTYEGSPTRSRLHLQAQRVDRRSTRIMINVHSALVLCRLADSGFPHSKLSVSLEVWWKLSVSSKGELSSVCSSFVWLTYWDHREGETCVLYGHVRSLLGSTDRRPCCFVSVQGFLGIERRRRDGQHTQSSSWCCALVKGRAEETAPESMDDACFVFVLCSVCSVIQTVCNSLVSPVLGSFQGTDASQRMEKVQAHTRAWRQDVTLWFPWSLANRAFMISWFAQQWKRRGIVPQRNSPQAVNLYMDFKK